MLKDQLKRALDRRRERGILRGLKAYDIVREGDASEQCLNELPSSSNQQLIDFSSNDYMGLARSESMRSGVLKALQDADSIEAIGSTGSRLLDGNSKAHERLEARLTTHFDAPAALLFNSGYDANSSLLSVLPQPEDYVLYDEYAHASMHDGMRASRVQRKRRIAFRHNDMKDLRAKVALIIKEISESSSYSNVFFAVEAVYSMDGDVCPLFELTNIVDESLPRKQRCIIVDEAHAVGLYGKHGAGYCEQLKLSQSIDIRLATFGKAFGCSGAAVLCSPLIRLFLINYARPLVFSTAIPHTSLVAINSALDVLCSEEGARRATETFSLTRTFISDIQDVLEGSNQAFTPSVRCANQADHLPPPPPIVPIVTRRARDLAQYLIANGFLIRPISFPTVPEGLERVRVCIHAHNTLEQVNALTKLIKEWLKRQEIEQRTEGFAVRVIEGLEKPKL